LTTKWLTKTSKESAFSLLMPLEDNVNFNKVTNFIPGRFAYKPIMKLPMELLDWVKVNVKTPVDLHIYKLSAFTNHLRRHYPLMPRKQLPQNWDLNTHIQAAAEDELVQCGKSTFFSDSINRELDYLNANYRRSGFYKLKETLLSQIELRGFERFGHLKLLKTIKLLLEGGVHQKIQNEKHSLDYLRRWKITQVLISNSNYNNRVSPVSLSSSIQSIFYIYLCLMTISCFVFPFEKIFWRFKLKEH